MKPKTVPFSILLYQVLLCFAVSQVIDVNKHFDERLTEPIEGLEATFNNALQALSNDSNHDALLEQWERMSIAVNSRLIGACVSKTVDSVDATKQIREEVQQLVSFMLSGVETENLAVRSFAQALSSVLSLEKLCPLLATCDEEKCNTTAVVENDSDGLTSPVIDAKTLSKSGQRNLQASNETPSPDIIDGSTIRNTGNEGCMRGNCTGTMDWGCLNDAHAEAQLLQACPHINSTTLSAVKSGEAQASLLFSASADSIASVCSLDGCLVAFQVSRCISPDVRNISAAVCSCHAALDVTCRAPFRNQLPALFALGDSELDVGNITALEGSRLQALANVSQPFCASCQSSLMETEQCAMLVPLTNFPCCVSDYISSGCAAVMAELPEAPVSEEGSEAMLRMAVMPDSVVALAEAFSYEVGADSLTTEQRVAKLEEASIRRLTEVVTVPLTGWCDTMKPDSLVPEIPECSVKMQTCLAPITQGSSRVTTHETDNNHLHATAFQFSPLGRTILGSAENVRTLTRGDLMDYIAAHYCAPRMVLSAGGAVDHTQLVSLAEKGFSNLPTGGVTADDLVKEDPAKFTGSMVDISDPDMPLVHLALAFQGVSWTDPDAVALMVMQAMLGSWNSSMTAGQHMGSRIAQLMSSNSLCNSYTAFNTNYKDTGLFGIYAVGSPETVEDMGWTMINNMTKMVYSVDENELLRARNQLKAQILFSQDGSAGIAEDIGRQLLTYGRRIPKEEMFARIDAVSPEVVKRVADRIIYNKDLAICAMGNTADVPDYQWFRRRTFWMRY